MTADDLRQRLRLLAREDIPLPAAGETPKRLRRLAETGLEDLSLAKLAEAHWDAISILAEAGKKPEPGAIYAVWASEFPGEGLQLGGIGEDMVVNGRKPFCSGLGLVDRALVTVRGPQPLLLDLDIRQQSKHLEMDWSVWATEAFRATQTGAITFDRFAVSTASIVGSENFYLDRAGFWDGACGPAACWVGGAKGLLSFAKQSKRSDPHTMAHFGAMCATVWMLEAALDQVGREIDQPGDESRMVRAMQFRHVVEQGCTDILRRFTRAYGPYPLAMERDLSRRYQELDLYLRQTHAERDLETLGRKIAHST